QPVDQLRRVIDAFRDGGGAGKRLVLQVQLAYGPSDEEAMRAAHDAWRTNVFDSRVLAELRMPEDFAAAAAFVTPEDVAASVVVSADPAVHVERLRAFTELGFEEIQLHNVHHDQRRFIGDFGAEVLPELAS